MLDIWRCREILMTFLRKNSLTKATVVLTTCFWSQLRRGMQGHLHQFCNDGCTLGALQPQTVGKRMEKSRRSAMQVFVAALARQQTTPSDSNPTTRACTHTCEGAWCSQCKRHIPNQACDKNAFCGHLLERAWKCKCKGCLWDNLIRALQEIYFVFPLLDKKVWCV